MTALSAALGFATTVISRIYTFYSSVILFFAFGIKMLKEGYEMSPTHGQVPCHCASCKLTSTQDELEEVTNEINKKQDEVTAVCFLAKRLLAHQSERTSRVASRPQEVKRAGGHFRQCWCRYSR